MIYDRHETTVQFGQVYLFRGLQDQNVDQGKYIHIDGISVNGKVQYAILDDDGGRTNIFSCSIADAVHMVREDIWEFQHDGPPFRDRPVDPWVQALVDALFEQKPLDFQGAEVPTNVQRVIEIADNKTRVRVES